MHIDKHQSFLEVDVFVFDVGGEACPKYQLSITILHYIFNISRKKGRMNLKFFKKEVRDRDEVHFSCI